MVSIGSRLSFNGSLCTVRYIGEVEGANGQWYGVEWDDSLRGKHSGEHRGVRYFQCRSRHPTAASFVRSNRKNDQPVLGCLDAAYEKYASELRGSRVRDRHDDDGSAPPSQSSTAPLRAAPVVFNGKVAEEVGFDTARERLANLAELRIVLLDGLLVRGVLASADDENDRSKYFAELEEISRTLRKATDLDLSRNLLEDWQDVADICSQLKDLQHLRLIGNRFRSLDSDYKFDGITELFLDETLLTWEEVASLTERFPSLNSLSISSNQFLTATCPLSSTIQHLRLEYNDFTSFGSLRPLSKLPNLERLVLRGNNISKIHDEAEPSAVVAFSPRLSTLDISSNSITSWSIINGLLEVFPGLTSLRTSENPLYDQPPEPSHISGMPEKPMNVDEAYMLTLARIGPLARLNYTRITTEDRLNAELYYLSLIRKELAAFPASDEGMILASHPRYNELCKLYGSQDIQRKTEDDAALSARNPRSLSARLVTIHFCCKQDDGSFVEHAKEIPKTLDVFRLKALAARLFGISFLSFKLVWETDEWDPLDEQDRGYGEYWDESDEEEEEQSSEKSAQHQPQKLKKREEELFYSRRDIGFWFDPNTTEAKIRLDRAGF